MKVYLLQLPGGRSAFFAEGERHEPGSATGLRGWLDRKSRAVQAALHAADKGPIAWMRDLWGRLHRRIAPDEAFLRRLGAAREVTLVHPSGHDPEAVRAAWSDYLAARGRRHGTWLGVDLLVSPLTLLLMPLPGPNVVGYWFVYRAACHALAWRGVRRARSGRQAVGFEPAEVLDAPLDPADDERVARVEAAFGLAGLRAFLHHHRPGPAADPSPARGDDARAQL